MSNGKCCLNPQTLRSKATSTVSGSSFCALVMVFAQSNDTFKASFQQIDMMQSHSYCKHFQKLKKKKSQERRWTVFARFKATLKKSVWTCFIETTNIFIGSCEILGYTGLTEKWIFILCLLLLASFQTNKSFDNGDLLEVSFIMIYKSYPKVSRQDKNIAFISLR